MLDVENVELRILEMIIASYLLVFDGLFSNSAPSRRSAKRIRKSFRRRAIRFPPLAAPAPECRHSTGNHAVKIIFRRFVLRAHLG